MATENIDPIRAHTPLEGPAAPFEMAAPAPRPVTGNLFEDLLGKAVDSLQGVSASELQTNAMIQGYLDGKVDLMDVVTAVSELNVTMQLAVTVANSAVQSFKEVTAIQI